MSQKCGSQDGSLRSSPLDGGSLQVVGTSELGHSVRPYEGELYRGAQVFGCLVLDFFGSSCFCSSSPFDARRRCQVSVFLPLVVVATTIMALIFFFPLVQSLSQRRVQL